MIRPISVINNGIIIFFLQASDNDLFHYIIDKESSLISPLKEVSWLWVLLMSSSAVSHQEVMGGEVMGGEVMGGEVMGGEAHRGQGWTCRRGGYTQTRSEKETSCSAWWGLTSGRWLPPRPEAPDISRNLPAWMSWSASNTPRHRHQQLCGYAVDRVAGLTPTSSAPTSSYSSLSLS